MGWWVGPFGVFEGVELEGKAEGRGARGVSLSWRLGASM